MEKKSKFYSNVEVCNLFEDKEDKNELAHNPNDLIIKPKLFTSITEYSNVLDIPKLTNNFSTSDLYKLCHQEYEESEFKSDDLSYENMKERLNMCKIQNQDFKTLESYLKKHDNNKPYCTCNKIVILNSIYCGKMKIAKVCDKYMLPYSTVWHIVNDYDHNDYLDLYNVEFCECKTSYKDILINFIKDFSNTTKYPFVVNDVCKKIKHDLDLDVKPEAIRNIMIEDLGLSYKKASSRPSSLNLKRYEIVNKIFAI